MTRFNYINENLERYKYETRIGHYSISILKHFAVYARYDIHRKDGNPVCLAVILTSEDFNICQSGVFKIIKKMEEDI
jgi:hypothetical protein